jgi:hypothetical protein
LAKQARERAPLAPPPPFTALGATKELTAMVAPSIVGRCVRAVPRGPTPTGGRRAPNQCHSFFAHHHKISSTATGHILQKNPNFPLLVQEPYGNLTSSPPHLPAATSHTLLTEDNTNKEKKITVGTHSVAITLHAAS